ncbi:MAG: SDR family NAD(P)-dependent oxidoreductase [Alphaproteobacteria bacterium]
MPDNKLAVIVGAGEGVSASFARLLAREGYDLLLAARNPDKLKDLCAETGAEAVACDASRVGDVDALFGAVDRKGVPDVVLYNPSYRTRGPLTDIRPEDVEKSLMVTAYGGFLVGQAAAKRMLEAGGGAILFTGASASVKGYPQSAPFAMGKFALRGLAQSMARELAPQNIHVAHFVIDGAIRSARFQDPEDRPDSTLDPDAIARTYLDVMRQPRSAWTWEVELRPWLERF